MTTSSARIDDLYPAKILRDGRMADLVKLHSSDRPETERQVWAVNVNAALGRFEDEDPVARQTQFSCEAPINLSQLQMHHQVRANFT